MLPTSSKLDQLLASLWTSPVFGDSFQGPITATVAATVDQIYARCSAELLDVLALAWPELDASSLTALHDQLAPKSVAFCAALGADIVADPERLAATAVAIALVYLADQTMDRGDEAMTWALERLSRGERPLGDGVGATSRRGRYLGMLGALVEQVTIMARPEDRFELLRCLIDDTLVREARVARLNQLYLEQRPDPFWQRYADEFAELVVMNGGFIAVAAMVYSVVRQHRPELPPLAAVLPGVAPVEAALRAGSGACRLYDDVGDRAIDCGTTAWGVFAINPCNQRDPRFLGAFLDALRADDRPTRAALLTAFADEDYDEVMRLTSAFARRQYAAIPRPLWDEYGVFLRLSQRVLEAGRVNTIGDDQLTDNLAMNALGAG